MFFIFLQQKLYRVLEYSGIYSYMYTLTNYFPKKFIQLYKVYIYIQIMVDSLAFQLLVKHSVDILVRTVEKL